MLELGSKGAAAHPVPDLRMRGWQVLYYPGEVNRCPGCGRMHWYVGRLSAECGFCGTAGALASTGMTGVGIVRQQGLSFDEAA